MIGKIRGIVLEKQPPQLLVDVQGVGYELDAPMSTFYQLPDVGHTVSLFTHFVVREDAHHLYGFYTAQERHLFRTLLKVNGVGPRSALTVLSSTTPEEFIRYILDNETVHLTRIPGIGKKTAERLALELRTPLSNWYREAPLQDATRLALGNTTRHQVLQDAVSALVALGYKYPEANRAISKLDDGVLPREELIRRALKEGIAS